MTCTVCGKKLRRHNKIGTCRQHRGMSTVRRAYETAWRQDHMPQYREAKRQWIRRNAKYYRDYREEPNHKLAHAIRTRIRRAVKSGSATENLGCSISELRSHIEGKFQPGMTWENYGAWHIDHIVPLSTFDLTDPEQFAKACHYTNLQPLWAEENSRKHDRLDYHSKSA